MENSTKSILHDPKTAYVAKNRRISFNPIESSEIIYEKIDVEFDSDDNTQTNSQSDMARRASSVFDES